MLPIKIMDSLKPGHPGYVLDVLKKAQVTEKEIDEFIHLVKSDLGQVFVEIGLRKYKVIPYGSAVTGLFTNGILPVLFALC